MFRVAIKESAKAHNERAREIAEAAGTARQFPSRRAAEEFTDDLCARGAPVRLQAPAPQDSDDVDAYLVKDGQAQEWEPIETDGHGATFPVGANVFGSLGLGVIGLDGRVSPALSHYFAELAPESKRGRVVNVTVHPACPEQSSGEGPWRPDVRVDVSSRGVKSRDVYFGEVKSGGASFQRNQRVGMQEVAESYGVLRIRVDLEELPDRYTVRIREITPDHWPR